MRRSSLDGTSRKRRRVMTGRCRVEVHPFINDFERPIGTYPYGRRIYETMARLRAVPNRVVAIA
jgi:hypothetical protein